MSEVSSFTIITGLSGAGKTQAMKALEDLGFFCIDNLPPALLPRLVELHSCGSPHRRFGIAIDVRVREYFTHLRESLEWLEQSGYPYQIVFLDCSDAVLLRRYSETRRVHPLMYDNGNTTLEQSIAAERRLLADARQMAHHIIDTTDLRPMDVRTTLGELLLGKSLQQTFAIDVFSFGYKYGLPNDGDIILDVRFIPNPYYVDELRPLTGKDKAVADYVLQSPITQMFVDKFTDLIKDLLPGYTKEGKSRLTIGIGCTGGQHRSVAVAIELGRRLSELGIRTLVRHREFSNPLFPAVKLGG